MMVFIEFPVDQDGSRGSIRARFQPRLVGSELRGQKANNLDQKGSLGNTLDNKPVPAWPCIFCILHQEFQSEEAHKNPF